jgi:hypothetical protein
MIRVESHKYKKQSQNSISDIIDLVYGFLLSTTISNKKNLL